MDKLIKKLRTLDPDMIPDELKSDIASIPRTESGERNADAAQKVIDKWQSWIAENVANWQDIKFTNTKPLKERLAALDLKKMDLSNENVIRGLAKQENASPAEVMQALAENKELKDWMEGRKRRQKEIKDAPWYSPWSLASEYSKQRYIDNPDASMFGKEGTYFKFEPSKLLSDNWANAFSGGFLSSEGQNEFRDVGLGASAAIGDVIPGVGGVLVGPAVRGTRDILNRGGDYGKSGSQIARDVFGDIALNTGVEYLPTAIINRGSKIVKNFGKSGSNIADVVANSNRYNALTGDVKLTQEVLDDFRAKGLRGKDATDMDVRNWLDRLPPSQIKNDLEAAFKTGGQFDVLLKVNDYEAALKKYKPENVVSNGYINTDFLWSNKANNEFGPEAVQAAYDRAMLDQLGKQKGVTGTAALLRGAQAVAPTLVKEGYTISGGRDGEVEESLDHKYARWAKGFVTPDEMKSEEYEAFKLNQLGE